MSRKRTPWFGRYINYIGPFITFGVAIQMRTGEVRMTRRISTNALPKTSLLDAYYAWPRRKFLGIRSRQAFCRYLQREDNDLVRLRWPLLLSPEIQYRSYTKWAHEGYNGPTFPWRWHSSPPSTAVVAPELLPNPRPEGIAVCAWRRSAA